MILARHKPGLSAIGQGDSEPGLKQEADGNVHLLGRPQLVLPRLPTGSTAFHYFQQKAPVSPDFSASLYLTTRSTNAAARFAKENVRAGAPRSIAHHIPPYEVVPPNLATSYLGIGQSEIDQRECSP
jgi:hypothetical protein